MLWDIYMFWICRVLFFFFFSGTDQQLFSFFQKRKESSFFFFPSTGWEWGSATPHWIRSSLRTPPPLHFWALTFLKKTMHKQNGLQIFTFMCLATSFGLKEKRIYTPVFLLFSIHQCSLLIFSRCLPVSNKKSNFFHDCPTPPGFLTPPRKNIKSNPKLCF